MQNSQAHLFEAVEPIGNVRVRWPCGWVLKKRLRRWRSDASAFIRLAFQGGCAELMARSLVNVMRFKANKIVDIGNVK
jgi:hypothetical protein